MTSWRPRAPTVPRSTRRRRSHENPTRSDGPVVKIAIVSMDTRGGIQPYIALALGLRRAGHEVRVVAPSDFAPMFSDATLPFAPLSGSVEAVVRGSAGATERGAIASMRLAAREIPARMEGWTRETLAALRGRRRDDRRRRRNGRRAIGRREAQDALCRDPPATARRAHGGVSGGDVRARSAVARRLGPPLGSLARQRECPCSTASRGTWCLFQTEVRGSVW